VGFEHGRAAGRARRQTRRLVAIAAMQGLEIKAAVDEFIAELQRLEGEP
jgi:hypothetical protein